MIMINSNTMINRMIRTHYVSVYTNPHNMFFYLTYRNYTDDRTGDELSDKSPAVRKCSLHTLIFEINFVYAFLKNHNSNYALSPEDILSIQNALLSGNYHLSPLRFIHGNSASPMLEASLADELVIGALSGILVKELGESCYFRKSCYSSYTNDRSLRHYLDTIQEWGDIEVLLLLDCSNSSLMFSRSRLLEKVRPIVHNDEHLVKLISSFCNLPFVIWAESSYSKLVFLL